MARLALAVLTQGAQAVHSEGILWIAADVASCTGALSSRVPFRLALLKQCFRNGASVALGASDAKSQPSRNPLVAGRSASRVQMR